MPNYDSIETMRDRARIFISIEFFRHPPDNVTIEWHDGWTADTATDTDGTVIRGGYCCMVRDHKPCHETCMKGVIVKLNEEPRRIWVLTGNADTRSTGAHTYLLGYEAVWPD
jgi:hypothetical protein